MLPKWRKQLVLWLYILCFSALLRGVFFYQNIHAPISFPDSNDEFVFQVLPGNSFTQVARQLKNSGVLKHSQDLRLYARFSGQAAQIKVGEYSIEKGLTALQLLEKLTRGEVDYHQLILLEGWTIAQALSAIQANDFIVSSLELDNGPALQEMLNTENYPEGLLFPDTYNFTRGTSDREIIFRAQELMTTVLEEEWARRAVGLPYDSPYDALIMASIVEKETGQASERGQIAGVFIRRLEQGMRLQTDPTVIYGLGAAYDGNLTRANLRKDTPYNTYTNGGLPPTPIALPGREAIMASLHPDSGDSLYFVAKGDGSHYFSSTLEEHNAAVRQYQMGQ